ncbi:MAG: tRNA (adenosine(37)-N6)-dimethylallyltransferase MiaA [Clostridia bacterium]|nr:tRNA (adenosine(37)-N6)-dimethylallyltransferase MiaA [Clostridia bacterium]
MNKAIIIAGPTASGKTALSIEICKKFNGEVISADSMQIYKGMDIATAKPTSDEMCGIPHHLMSIADPSELFSVAKFKTLAEDAIEDILSRGKLPVIVGGTGLYIDSLINNTRFGEFDGDDKYREQLRLIAEKNGNAFLWNMLMEADEPTASRVNPNDLKRVIRALEVYHCTGKRMSEYDAVSHTEKSKYDYLFLGLFFEDRSILYDRINKRVDKMFECGLVQEAQRELNKNISSTARQAIGYKELIPYFKGHSTLEEVSESLKKATRNYAKRQLTWFRRYENIVKIFPDKNQLQNSEEIIRSFLN